MPMLSKKNGKVMMGKTDKDRFLRKLSRDIIGRIPRVKVFEDSRLDNRRLSTREILTLEEDDSNE